VLMPLLVVAQDPSTSSSAASASASVSVTSSALSAPSTVIASSGTVPISATGSTSAISLSSTTSAAPTTGATQPIITPPNTPSTFSPFPVPSDTPQPTVYPATDPSQPPEVGSTLIPDFGPAWAQAWAKAKAKIASFSLEEKVNVTTGVGWEGGRCVGNTPAILSQNFPGLCLEDSPLGVRNADFVTSFPTGINTAASFNRRLIRLRGLLMGREHVGKGVNIALGPMMNMGRLAQGGRNWEGFGADPYLSGEAAYETILGMQQGGVIGCAKHLVGNEQEYKRSLSSSDIDDRTMHEIYAHPFLRSVMAGVGSLMCSYNLLNGTYACENDKLMNDIVKREMGFQGFIMTDWSGQHSTISANTGLDMTMPGDITFSSGTSWWGANLTAYVRNGTISESRVDDMATRILASWYLLHQDAPTFPAVNFDAFNPDSDITNSHIDVQASSDPEDDDAAAAADDDDDDDDDDLYNHSELVRELGAASAVLLKNKNGALPLGKKDRSIVLVGSGAGPGRSGPNEFGDQGGAISGVLAMGWGSGTANFTYLISPLAAIQQKARKYRTSVSWLLDDFDLPKAGNMARKRSAALVFLKADSGEGYISVDGNNGDRKNLTAWFGGDDLVLAVAAQNNNTIVIVNSVGPLIVEPWIDHPNVTAVVWAGLAGQEAGNSITDVLYGEWNPSGRLPYTIAKSPSDYPAQITTGGGPTDVVTVPYTEGLFIDYRHFDANNITPRFEFGFGLSYTTFEYSKLKIKKLNVPASTSSADRALIEAWQNGTATPIAEGSSRAVWLHEPAWEVTFRLENTGKVDGGDIPQLYVAFPPTSGEPPLVLRGFTNIELESSDDETVSLTLSRYDLSIWDAGKQGWAKPAGEFGVVVGTSSRDGKLKGSVPL